MDSQEEGHWPKHLTKPHMEDFLEYLGIHFNTLQP